MTQQEKDLLLKDLCGRLPYGVKVIDDMGRICTLTLGNTDLCSMFYGDDFDQGNTPSICKPYLRPMSSMTEEEKKEYHELCDSYYGIYFKSVESIDWLNAHHFDYRGLIPMGLAIEVTEENNPYK